MARGRIITPQVEALISRVHLNHPKMTANEVRNLVKSELRTNENYSTLWPIPKEWPSLSKVQKVLAKVIREQEKLTEEGKKQEEPWDISTLGKYPIPPEAVPLVLDVSMQSRQPLSIREAQWIGRLYNLLSMVFSQQSLDAAPIAFIEGMAAFYATSERINNLMGQRVVEPGMDEILWKYITKRETFESVSEAYKRVFRPGMKDSRWRMDESGALSFMVTKEELCRVNEIGKKIGHSRTFEDSVKDTIGITLEVKEAQHERQHKTKRQE